MKDFGKSLFLPISSILLCWIAFYNGYPLVYSDTGTYLESGFTFETPLDRPITYGIFIRLASLNSLSVWTIILTQSLLIIWLIRETLKTVFPEQKSDLVLGIISVALAFLTGLPVVSSQLIADIFTPITILALFLFLFGKFGNLKTVFIGFILLLACACHISHVMLCVAIAVCVAIIFFIRKRRKMEVFTSTRKIIIALVLPVVALTSMLSAISKSRHVFMMGHLIETGILDQYLDDHCSNEEISFCRYRELIPESAEPFIWNLDGDSLLLRTGGWKESKEEYSKIISATFREWKYVRMHLVAAANGTGRQLLSFRVGEGLGRYDSSSLVSQRLNKYFPESYSAYLRSRQSDDEFSGSRIIEAISNAAIGISVLVIIVWWLLRRRRSDHRLLTALVLSTAFALVINSAICATFSTVTNRYGARLSWMVVLLAAILICDWMNAARKNRMISK